MIRMVLKDSLVYGLSLILTKGLAVLLLPIYARAMSIHDFGAYDLLVTLAVLGNLIITLEISQGLARHWVDASDKAGKVQLASTALYFTVGMYILFLAVGLFFIKPLGVWLFDGRDYTTALRLGLGFIAANGLYYLLLNQLRWELRSKAYAAVNFAYALVTLLLASVFCFRFQMGIEGAMLSQLLAAAFAALLSLWLLRGSFAWRIDGRALRAMLAFSLPLVPAGLAIFVSLYINRLALSHFTTLEDVGLFGMGTRIAGLVSLLIMGVQAALTPLVYQHYQEKETPERVARLFGWFLALALAACLCLTLFARELLQIVATSEYDRGARLVVFLAPALLLSQMYIFAPGIGIRKKTYWQLWITLLTAVVSAVGNYLLVPRWGITGAAVVALLSASVFFACWVRASQWLYPIPYAWKSVIWPLIVFAFCAATGFWVEGIGLHWLLTLAIKGALILILMPVLVGSGLLPWSDVRCLIQCRTSAADGPGDNRQL
jgi:O-antigen/teichoic acid export membrane protein